MLNPKGLPLPHPSACTHTPPPPPPIKLHVCLLVLISFCHDPLWLATRKNLPSSHWPPTQSASRLLKFEQFVVFSHRASGERVKCGN